MSTKETCCLLVTGGPDSGKTVAACNVFTHLTLGGGVKTTTPNGREVRFTLVPDSHSDSAGADIDRFTNIYLDMLNGRPLPNQNTENHTYELLFQDNGNNICSILYLDYRGGITRQEDARKIRKEEVDELDYMMEHSTLLIYIIPGNVLNDYISLQGKDLVTMTPEERTKFVKVSAEVSQIKFLIEKAEELGNAAPLLFYVTKSDLVYTEEEIIPGLERLIRQFILCKEGRKTLGCHSTLGRNVVIKKTIGENGVAIRQIDTGLDPVGFEIPMMLTVGYRMSAQGRAWASAELDRIKDEIDALKKDIKDLEIKKAVEKESLPNRIKGFLLRRPVHAITDLQKDIEDDEQRVAQLQEELQQVDGRNAQKGFSEDILSYLNEHHGNSILYINEEGQSRPLSEFFK